LPGFPGIVTNDGMAGRRPAEIGRADAWWRENRPAAPLAVREDLKVAVVGDLKGIYGSGTKSNKIDYILLSPALRATVSAVGVERRGVWAPRTFPHLPEIGNAVEAASDHAAVWVDLP